MKRGRTKPPKVTWASLSRLQREALAILLRYRDTDEDGWIRESHVMARSSAASAASTLRALERKCLVEHDGHMSALRRRWRLTPSGHQVWKDGPAAVRNGLLSRFPGLASSPKDAVG